jgi:hypothetical protein
LSAVVTVFFVWFTAVVVLGVIAIALADRMHVPVGLARLRIRAVTAIDTAAGVLGRAVVSAVIALAGWSIVIIVGWLLGLGAHRIEGAIDRPAFNWWQDHYLRGTWHTVWWKLTNIGSPNLTQAVALLAVVGLPFLYRKAPRWWAPSVAMLAAYPAEHYAQTILKLVVHRGHPPTTHGTWPSGGMGRLISVYGLVIFFVVLRYWRPVPRAWAAGATLLALLASIQAYARINNLEHWLTDVVGGAIFGTMLLGTLIAGFVALAWDHAVLPAARGGLEGTARPESAGHTVT